MSKVKSALRLFGLSSGGNSDKWTTLDYSGAKRFIDKGPLTSDPNAHSIMKRGLEDAQLYSGESRKMHITKALLAIYASPWFRRFNDVRAYGAKVGSISDSGPAMRKMLTDTTKIRVPTGVLRLDSIVEAETSTDVWQGLYGDGHQSVIEVDTNGGVEIQTQVPGGAIAGSYGAQWTYQGIFDVTFDGMRDTGASYPGGASPNAILVGTDTDAGETTVDNSGNGMAFARVGVFGFEVGVDHGFVTGVSWEDSEVRYCGVGMRFVTNSDSSASDGWTLKNINFLNNELAALAVQADTVNDLTGTIIGGFCNGQIGWGFYFEHEGEAPGNYTIIGTHFERCGRRNTVERADVTIPGSSLTIEPKGVYVNNCNVKFIGCRFGNSAVHVAPNGQAIFDNCAMPTAIAGGGGTDVDLHPFYGTEKGAWITIGEGNTFTNPTIDTLATIDWQGRNRVKGSTNDKQFIQSRIPPVTRRIIGGSYSDPCFESGLSGFAGSTTNAPTITHLPTGGLNGDGALQCVFGASAGGQNDNALRPPIHASTIAVDDYMAMNMLIKADADTTLKVFSFVTTNNNNMGTATVELFQDEWTRIGILWHYQFGTADTDALIGIYPEGSDAPTIEIDCIDVEVGPFGKILPFLQGAIGEV